MPEALINNIFSLSDKEKRESLSLGVVFNDDGTISSTEIVQSLIQVDYRLDFTEADELIDYAPKEEEDLSVISSILEIRKSWRKKFMVTPSSIRMLVMKRRRWCSTWSRKLGLSILQFH